jgi:predicted HAD superfamily Cof-like phosphohydrolase
MTVEQMVRYFHRALRVHGGLMPPSPTADVRDAVRDSRIELLLEEVGELEAALRAGDLVGIADGIADVVFVAYGTGVVYGLPVDRLVEEVWRSNMTKTNDRAAPKLVKGPGYESPRIRQILEAG